MLHLIEKLQITTTKNRYKLNTLHILLFMLQSAIIELISEQLRPLSQK